MSILNYFKAKTTLPTASQPSLTEDAVQCANREVERVLEELQMQGGRRKRKAYSTFSDEDRAVIGKYAAENGNASALKKFKVSKPGLIESTVRSFKQKYVGLLQ